MLGTDFDKTVFQQYSEDDFANANDNSNSPQNRGLPRNLRVRS